MANDDKPVGTGILLQSYLSELSTFLGSLTNSPGNVVAGTDYVLVVTYASNNLLEAGSVSLVEFNSTILDLDGINPASSGVPFEWQTPGAPNGLDDDFSYAIVLGGAEFAVITPVPEPRSLAQS